MFCCPSARGIAIWIVHHKHDACDHQAFIARAICVMMSSDKFATRPALAYDMCVTRQAPQIVKSVLLSRLNQHMHAGVHPFCSPVRGQSMQTMVLDRPNVVIGPLGMGRGCTSAQSRQNIGVSDISPFVSTIGLSILQAYDTQNTCHSLYSF